MTGWHLFAGYVLVGFGYFVLSIGSQTIGSMSRPPVDGHLDVRIRFGLLEWCYIVSVVLIFPWVIAYAGDSSRGYGPDRLQREMMVLGLYVMIAVGWIIKLQLQLNWLINRKD